MIVPLARTSLGLTRLCGLGALLALLLAPVPAFADAGASLLRLDRAAFVLSDSPEPPADSAAWQPQALPDNWLVSRPGVSGYGWYRLRLDLPAAPEAPYRRLRSAAGERRSALCERRLRRPDRRLRQGLARSSKSPARLFRAVRRSGSDFPRTCSPCVTTFCMPAATPSICVCGSKTVRAGPCPA